MLENGAAYDAPEWLVHLLDDVCDRATANAWWRNPIAVLGGRSPRQAWLDGDAREVYRVAEFFRVPPLT